MPYNVVICRKNDTLDREAAGSSRFTVPSRNLLILFLAAVVSLACYTEAEHGRYLAVLADAMGLIEDNYLEPVEERTLFEGAMEGMVASLNDQYSSFIPPQSFTEFQASLDQEFGGVGIIVEPHPESKYLTVISPLVNTPAYEGGVRAGDVILTIDGKTTRDLAIGDAVSLMRGPPGSMVRLSIQRMGLQAPLQIELERRIIPIESVLGDVRRPDGVWNYFLESQPRIGYIRLVTFGDHTVREMETALKQYEQHPIDALILDMRGNAGGYLNAAIDVSNMFIEQGRIVSTRGRDGEVRVAYDARPSKRRFPLNTPMAVLVNSDSASASEIVAACLQDHHRASIVGERSWGKGTVQNVIELEGGKSALKLTTASYWRPSGKNIHRTQDAPEDGDWGVNPDPELLVPIDDRVKQEVQRLRSLRDIVLRPGEDPPSLDWAFTLPEDQSASDGGAGATNSKPASETPTITEWLDDPQLQRAIQHLRQEVEQAGRTSNLNRA